MSGRIPASRKARIVIGFVVSFFALVSIGCGGKKATVSGKVNYRGNPLPVGTITFFNAKNEIVGGSEISNGSYKIVGVPVGPVKITVVTPPLALPPVTAVE